MTDSGLTANIMYSCQKNGHNGLIFVVVMLERDNYVILFARPSPFLLHLIRLNLIERESEVVN